jgi:hypothetical protein
MDESGSYPFVLPPASRDGHTPTDAEQIQMAEFWETEEQRAPKGWDEEEELDYSEVVRRREERQMSRPRDSSEEMPDLFKYSQSTIYTVKTLGHISPLPSTSTGSQTQTATLAIIDKTQRQGLLPWVTSESDQRLLSISKYGIKVMDTRKQRIFARHALHYIINITYYEDTYGKHMLAVKVATTTSDRQQRQELHIYEANDESQAKDICLTLGQAFEAVHNNLRLQQNLTSEPR